jgi:hypothetical protein
MLFNASKLGVFSFIFDAYCILSVAYFPKQEDTGYRFQDTGCDHELFFECRFSPRKKF